MERAILVRHGESEFSARRAVSGNPAVACPLTPEGRTQAMRLAPLLADEELDLCITSEFPRTRETADLILADRDVPRLVVGDLNDPNAGSFDGGPLDDYLAWAHSHGPVDEPPGGGESRAAIVARYARGFRCVLERPERTILVVIHSLPIAYVRAAAEGRDPAAAMGLVPYCEAYRLTREELERVVERLDRWAAQPAFA
ncbi:MAG: histidine phosphatase family protein [Thermoleophilia bacterium]|nr:histidine phosphatase family protein [Thermoleophilia bacterium]